MKMFDPNKKVGDLTAYEFLELQIYATMMGNGSTIKPPVYFMGMAKKFTVDFFERKGHKSNKV
jgi:hypothetical protein